MKHRNKAAPWHIPLYECAHCARLEERVWTDSFTGTDLCIQCLIDLPLSLLTNSPATEGDNLDPLLTDEEEAPRKPFAL